MDFVNCEQCHRPATEMKGWHHFKAAALQQFSQDTEPRCPLLI